MLFEPVTSSPAESFQLIETSCTRTATGRGDILLPAKTEHGLVVPSRESVDLATAIRALFDYYDAVAEEEGLQLALAGDAKVSAGRLMLRRAFGKLLSNAVRHPAANSNVQDEISANPKVVSIGMTTTDQFEIYPSWQVH